MNAYAYYIVNQHIESLLEQAANERLVATRFPKPTLRARIASATAGLRGFFANPIDLSGPVLPKLENYTVPGLSSSLGSPLLPPSDEDLRSLRRSLRTSRRT